MKHLTCLLLLPLAACGDDPAPGQIEIRIYGEAFIEEAIPADAFVDGWSVTFDRFLVSLGGLTAEAGHHAAPLTSAAFQIWDLAQPSGGAGYLAATLEAPGGVYDHFGYVIGPDPDATAGNADADDVAAMKAAGERVRVAGRATDGTVTIRFDWGFSATHRLGHCEVMMPIDGNTGVIQATIHGDHLFYDDAVSAEPDLAFQAIADADGADGTTPDGAVTAAELAAVDLAGFERYQVGSYPIHDLWAFIRHQVGTLGHVDGEGHCASSTVTP